MLKKLTDAFNAAVKWMLIASVLGIGAFVWYLMLSFFFGRPYQ